MLEEIDTPSPQVGEALEVHAAAITRDELTWPIDRLPATPSYELSGVVAALASVVKHVAVGEAVYALTGFERDGVAAAYAAVPASFLAPKPATLDHVESAAVPLAALSAWQGLFDHGHLAEGERVLIHGAAGGVGHFATQLARWCGAYVIGTASADSLDDAHCLGAQEVLDGRDESVVEEIDPVDLVFDTVGGKLLGRSPSAVREGGRIVSMAEEPAGSRWPGDRRELLRRRAKPRAADRDRASHRRGSNTPGDRLDVRARRCPGGLRTKPRPWKARQGGDPGSRRVGRLARTSYESVRGTRRIELLFAGEVDGRQDLVASGVNKEVTKPRDRDEHAGAGPTRSAESEPAPGLSAPGVDCRASEPNESWIT
jgi:NADPH:quinone reductase-like Zn-dependent oxidoreductase